MATERSLVDKLRVEPGTAADLGGRSAADRLGFGKKPENSDALDRLEEQLDVLHDRLWAEASRSVVLVLQGLDASGKDGTIRRVLSGLNPQGCQVVELQGTHHGRARARLLVARTRGVPSPRDSRRVEPVALRGRGHGARARADRRQAAHAPLPAHPRVRAHADRRRHDRRQGVPAPLQGGAARPAAGAHRRPEEELEVPLVGPRGAGEVGRVSATATSVRSPRPRRSGHRGTSCRPITSGSATSPSPRSSSTPSSGSTRRYPIPNRVSRGSSSRSRRGFPPSTGPRGAPSARMGSRWTSSRVIPSL